MTFRAELLKSGKEADNVHVGPRERSEVTRRAVLRARILVVDDEPLFGQTLSMLLGRDHDVVVELSGRGALARLAHDHGFDLLVCDLSLPDLDGAALYERVAAERPELCERFVFVTGGAFTETTRDFLARHRGPHLEKPFRISELERLIEGVCGPAALSA